MSLPPVSRARPHSCSSCTLQQSFCRFPEELRAAFDALKTTLAFAKGETVFHEGDHCRSVFALCEGGVKLVTTSSEGRALLLRFAGPGEMLGLAEAMRGAAPYECSAIASESSILAVIPRDTFLRFIASYPQACFALTVALSEQYKLAQRETKFFGLGDSSTIRLAHLLLEWSAEHGTPAGDGGVHVPLHVTHGELAQAIGATRETVTRLLSNLAAAGMVERRDNAIVVLRPDLLTAAASHPVTASRDGDAPESGRGDVSVWQEPLAPGGSP